MKKIYTLIVLFSLLFCYTGNVWGETLTVADGSETNKGVPICGNYADTKGMRSQFIYPSSLLTNMEYGTISKVKFYSSTASKEFTSTFEVRLSEISASTLSGFNTDGGTIVYTGSLTIASNEMEITFDTPYEYNGNGNLLFDIEVTAKTSAYVDAAFYGISQSGAGYSNKVYYGSAQVCNLLPKATFTYTPGTAPTCPKPKNLNMTDLSSASVSFAWTKGDAETSWQYICLPAATAVDWSDTGVKTATSTTATVTGLTAETSYKFYVRAYCSGSDQSGELVKAFKTPCAGESLPWDCGFESSEGYSTGSYSSAAPACWNILNANQGAVPYIYISTSYAKSGNGLYFESSKSKYGYIILPPFEHGLNVLKLSFSHKEEGTSATAGQISVGYMTDPTDEKSFVPVQVCTRKTSHTTVSDILFTDAPSYGRITFRYGGGTADNWYAGIDDIHVEATLDCSKPATPTYSDLTGSSVTLSWTANSGVTDYKYINVDRTANPSYVLDWENDATAISATSVDLTSLTDGHNYEFYVMCACGTVASDACEYTPLSCPTVTGVTLSNQLWDRVTVNWTTSATTNCDVQYLAGSGKWQAAETNTSATSKTITGLSVGTEYSFRVKPNCSDNGWVSPASTYTPACPTPGTLTLSNETYNGVTVSWSAIDGVNAWNLQYQQGSLGWVSVTENPLSSTTYTFTDLVTNAEYSFQVQAECEGEWSPVATYTPVYAKPSSATVSTIKDNSAYASWITVDGVSGYQYSCVPTGDADSWSATQASNSASLTGLSAAVGYTFKVRAVYGTAPSIAYSAATEKTFTTVCQAPTSLVKGATTSSSLAFSWSKSAASNADNRYQYVCKEGSTAPTDDQWANDAVLLDEGVRTATVENLSSNTTYYFFVRSYYGVGKYSTAISDYNKTDCGTASLPFTKEQFSSSLPACWVSSYTGNEWGYEYYGTYKSAYYSAQYLANTATSNSADLKTPTISVTDKATLTFWYRNYYYKSSKTYYATGEVLFDDGETETKLWDIDQTSSSIVQKSIDLSDFNLVGKTGRFVFRGHGAGTSSYARMWIDDVEITVNSISAPTNLAVAPTADGADVTWDAEEGPYDLQYRVNGSSSAWTSVNSIAVDNYTITGLTADVEYEVQVRAHASVNRISAWTTSQTFTPEACPKPTTLGATAITHNSATISWNGDAKAIRYKTGAAAWSNKTISPAATTFFLSGLTPESTYTVQVKADCEDGDNWSTELEFTTKCAPITITKAAPYEADFSGLSNEMPACWEKSETTYPYVTSSELKFYANDANQTAILPAFSNDIASLKLKFKYKNYSGMSGYGKLQVGYIDNAGDFQAVGSTLTNKASYFETEVEFDEVTNAKNIAIRFTDNSNAAAYSYVKDVVVELAPTCYAPASIADPTSVTSTGATFTWAASSKNNETHYQYICVPAGETPNWNNSTKVEKAVSNTTSLTGLNPYTSYDFYVRSWCSADDQSEAISKNFETECGTYSMPFVEDFATTTLSKCWTVTGTSTSSYNWKVYTDEYGHKGSTYRARFTANTNNASGKTGSLESPSITLTNDAALHFYYSNPKGASLKVYIKEGDNDRVELADLSDATNAWTGQNILIPETYNTKTVKFYFDAVSNATSNSYVDIDQVHVNHMLKDSKNNSTLLASLNGQTVDVTLGRTLVAADYYNTLCLPFSLSTLTGTPLEGGDLWAFKYAKVDEATDELLFRIVQSDHIEAGVPYFIAFPNNAEDIVNPFFENVTISAATGQKIGDASIAQFCGILQPETLVAGDATKLFLAAENTLYWWNGASNSTLKSFRAYFYVNTGGGSSSAPIRRGMPARIIREEQVATGAENAQDNGARCIKMIENEQLIIIRDGVKYNVQGQKIQ